ncbi:hypothetical protein [Oharaeibacter diazotrophicus]|nr:hypothetical protein [Oharaeibacter diazotrophicus]BBE71168.1 hypothetical protein OHA_1_00738 [Pleomorphomonas sp. SM30]GLS77922.1 hypothetical protein GCM10007904_32590 [Oharaeibacter diazotrophicus]
MKIGFWVITALLLGGSNAESAAKRTQPYASTNDNFESALDLPSSTIAIPGTLTYNSRQFGEPRARSTSIGRTAWYTFTATATGRAVVAITSNESASAPLDLAVYTGSTLSALKVVGTTQITKTGTRGSGSVAFNVIAGNTYRIQVDASRKLGYNDRHYWIGAQLLSPAGGIAIFGASPWFIREGDGDTLSFFSANGYAVPVKISEKFGRLSPYFTIKKTSSTLQPGRVSWYTISDRPTATLPDSNVRAATLEISATSTSTGSKLGTNSVVIAASTKTYELAPNLVTQFDYPEQGSRAFDQITSDVTVYNDSETDTAVACIFRGDNDWSSPVDFAALDRSSGATSDDDTPFDLAPGESRDFRVSVRTETIYQSYARASLDCGNVYSGYNSDKRAYLQADGYFGAVSQVQIDALNTLDRYRIKLDVFQTKRVTVAVRNTGDYAGFFRVQAQPSGSVGITRTCESDESGNCIGDADISSTEVNIGRDETVYVTFRMNRSSGSDADFVDISATSIDGPEERTAGATNVQMIVPADESGRH